MPRSHYDKEPLMRLPGEIHFDADVVEFVAVRDIESGDEITIDCTEGGRNERWFPL